MMTPKDIDEFCQNARNVSKPESLKELLQDTCGRMGFKYFALTHHIDLRDASGQGVHIVDYPEQWMDQFRRNQLFASDPIHRACRTTSLGFRWSDVDKMISLSPRDNAILSAAREAGLGEGFTVPAHIPGETNGSCSFAMARGESLVVEQLPFLQLVGACAFESARRFARLPIEEPPRLTERQIECVILVAKGKTDWEIAKILGVSHETVVQHVKDARDRYGVGKRTLLAVRALFDGSISFADILRR